MKKVLLAFSNIFASTNKDSKVQQELKAFAHQRYPDNLQAQDYIFKKEMSSYDTMKEVTDIEIKEIAQKQYPSDYAMQEYIYYNQLADKNFMNSIQESPAKKEAMRRYPKDYSTQKFIYSQLVKVTKRSA